MRKDKDGFSFYFTDALDVIDFDNPTYHGVPAFKAVDLVVEFKDKYIYVEIKDHRNRGSDKPEITEQEAGMPMKKDKEFNDLIRKLKYKYRDSYLYRHAESKVDKPIDYICLLTFDGALISRIQQSLHQDLPVGIKGDRWRRQIINDCHVVNLRQWKDKFKEWPIEKITTGET